MPYKAWYLPGTVIILAALALVYYQFDPGRYIYFPKCPFHSLTGLDCPGCGSQRAIHALLHGHVAEAADHNLLLVLAIPFLSVHYYHKLRATRRHQAYNWRLVGRPATAWLVFSVVMVFWVLRNIPAAPFHYLAAGQ